MTWTELATWGFDGPWRNFWPLLVLPPLAGLISDRCARLFPTAGVAPYPAAALAVLPGLVTLGLASMAVGQGLTRGLPDSIDDIILGVVTPGSAIFIVLFAARRAWPRALALRRLRALSSPPGARLVTAAHEAGVTARELPLFEPECFIAGFLHPVVFVSRGALERLSDAELRAMLHHEGAHGRSRDPAMFGIVSFLADLAPMTHRAENAYRCACELRADTHAAARAGSLPLATALLVMARAHDEVPAVAMSSTGGAWRLELLLGLASPPPLTRRIRWRIWLGVVANGLLAVWPLPHIMLLYAFCSS
jgi:Zn-dependent protease with chaperone function